MLIDKAKIKDYITTLTFAAVPVVIAYQAQIGQYVPVEYALGFTIVMGILSQIAGNKRVQIAQATTVVNDTIVKTNDVIDMKQLEVEDYQKKIEELQKKVDEYQALSETILPVDEEGMA